MVINDEYTGDRDRRRGGTAIWEGPERRGSRISPAAGGQLLEEGDAPLGPVGTFGESNSEFTSQGGEGSNQPNDWTHQRNQTELGALGTDDREGREPDEADPRSGGTGDEGGAATLGGGVYQGQGETEDFPRHGDWGRRTSGASSGARGHEGEDFPGENTFGEAQAEAERKATMGRRDNPDPTAQADGDDGDASTGGIPESTGERKGKGKTHKGPTGEGQIGNAQTAKGGERDRKSQPPGQK